VHYVFEFEIAQDGKKHLRKLHICPRSLHKQYERWRCASSAQIPARWTHGNGSQAVSRDLHCLSEALTPTRA
jgi:hypothetical protein